MKSKILLVVMLLISLPTVSLKASDDNQLPKWIEVQYADLEHNTVSEYQLVTVTVTEKNLWLDNSNHEIIVDYNPQQLNLVNTVSYDTMHNVQTEVITNYTTDASSFGVSYQFYLQPGVSLTNIPITITKMTDGQVSDEATINLAADSQTVPELVTVGDIKLESSVTEYVNDGTNITYNQHFSVVANPNNSAFTLTLKPNNMVVEDPDIYEAKIKFDSGSAKALDKNNFELNMNTGDQFDLNITTTIEGLKAKDDRFEFFVYLQEDDQFVRLEPTFFRSEQIAASTDTRNYRYLVIKLIIAIFFIILTIIHLIKYKVVKKD